MLDEHSLAMTDIPEIAPRGPHHKLTADLISFGLDGSVAEVISRAAVNPSDARRRLSNPDIQRTSNADIHTISMMVWSPLICAHPDNKRETAFRDLPITGATTEYPPLSDTTSDGNNGWLRIAAASPAHLVHTLNKSESFLVHRNPLWEQIGEEGVLRPITVVGLKVDFTADDAFAPIALAASADGSSRISSAHRNLGITSSDVVRFASDDQAFRRFLGEAISRGRGGDLTEGDRRALRSLVVPADVVVRVEPRPGTVTTTARAVRALVGLMHVQPPMEWMPAAKLDAQADEVLEDLLSGGRITQVEHEYLAGRMTLEEARGAGLPPHADERAALILRVFAQNDSAVKQAIKRVTHSVRIHKGPKANVAVELAIRSYRKNATSNESDIHTSRVALQLAYRLKEFWESPWEISGRTPEELRDQALSDLGGESLSPAQIELGILGAFELTRIRNLTQFSLTRDSEAGISLMSPAAILRMMLESRLGIQTLYQAVSKGRLGAAKFVQLDENGHEIYTPQGEQVFMSQRWLRDTFRFGGQALDETAEDTLPELEYRRRQDTFKSTVHSLRPQLAVLTSLRDETGAELVRTLGWRPEDALPMVREFNGLIRSMHSFVAAYRIANNLTFGLSEDTDAADEVDEDDMWT